MPTKLQHYVPQFYLEGFQDPDDPGCVWVYEKGSVAQRCQPIKVTAAEMHYYSIDMPDGRRDDTLERSVLAKVESSAAHIIKRWRTQKRPEIIDSDREPIALFFACLVTRSPRARRHAEEIMAANTRARLLQLAEDQGSLDQFIKENPDIATSKAEVGKLIEEIVDPDETKLRASKNAMIGMTFLLVNDVLTEVLQRPWCLCTAPEGAEFITSDTPLSIFALEEGGGALIGAGFGLPHADLILPINPKRAVRISHLESRIRRRVSKTFVREANRRIACQAERYAYACRESKRIRTLVSEFEWTRDTSMIDEAVIRNGMKTRFQDQKGMN